MLIQYVDSDEDGFLSLSEFLELMQQTLGRRRSGAEDGEQRKMTKTEQVRSFQRRFDGQKLRLVLRMRVGISLEHATREQGQEIVRTRSFAA